MLIMKTIFNIFKHFVSTMTFRDVIYIFIIIVSLSALGSSIRQCSKMQDKYDNNMKALRDSIRYTTSKSGNTVAMKQAFKVDDISEMLEFDKTLFDKIKDMGVHGTPQAATYFSGDIDYGEHDTVYVVHHDTVSNGFSHDFDFSNKYRELSGNVSYENDSLNMKISRDIMQFDYTVAIDKNNEIRIMSDNPYVKYREMSGFTITKTKQKRFGLGIHTGYGYSVGQNKFTPYIGVGVHYNIFSF